MLAQQPEGRVQLAHEHFPSPLLISFVPLGCILALPPADVSVSLSAFGGEGRGEEAPHSTGTLAHHGLSERTPLPNPLPASREREMPDGGSVEIHPYRSKAAWMSRSACSSRINSIMAANPESAP